MQFTAKEFIDLRSFAFSAENKGYRPDVVEAPNGDGVYDVRKRFAHVAPKYGLGRGVGAYSTAFRQAVDAASVLYLPCEIGPDSTLRVLEYPPRATSAPHTDFCLFTLSLYRSHPDAFKYTGDCPGWAPTIREQFPRIHFGELMTEIMGVPATPHEVIATATTQHAAVFFAMPPLSYELPSGLTVNEWLDERKGRSRRQSGDA